MFNQSSFVYRFRPLLCFILTASLLFSECQGLQALTAMPSQMALPQTQTIFRTQGLLLPLIPEHFGSIVPSPFLTQIIKNATPASPWITRSGPLVGDLLSVGSAFWVFGAGPAGVAFAVLSPFLFRAAMTLSTYFHENAHAGIARLLPGSKDSAAVTSNRQGNLSWQEWTRNILPFRLLQEGKDPYVRVQAPMTKAQDRMTRWGGPVASAGLAVVATITLLNAAVYLPVAAFFSLSIVTFGFAWVALMGVESDFFGPMVQGFYFCGWKVLLTFEKPVRRYRFPIQALNDPMYQDFLLEMGIRTVIRGGHADKITVFLKNKEGRVISMSYAVGNSLGGTLEEEALDAFKGQVNREKRKGYQLLEYVIFADFTRFATSGNGMDPAFAQGSRWGEPQSVEAYTLQPVSVVERGLSKFQRFGAKAFKIPVANNPQSAGEGQYKAVLAPTIDETTTWFNGDFNSFNRRNVLIAMAKELGISNASHFVDDELLGTGHMRAFANGLHKEPYQSDLDNPNSGPDGPVWAGVGRLMTTQGIWAKSVAAAYFLAAHSSASAYFSDDQLSANKEDYIGANPDVFKDVGQLFQAMFEQLMPTLNLRSPDLKDIPSERLFEMADQISAALSSSDGEQAKFLDRFPPQDRERYFHAMLAMKGWAHPNGDTRVDRMKLVSRLIVHLFRIGDTNEAFKLMLEGTAIQGGSDANAFGGGMLNTRFIDQLPIIALGGQPLTVTTDASHRTISIGSERRAPIQHFNGQPLNRVFQLHQGEMVTLRMLDDHFTIDGLFYPREKMELVGQAAEQEWQRRTETIPVDPDTVRPQDPIAEGLTRVQGVAESLHQAFLNPDSSQYKAAMSLFRHIDAQAQNIRAIKRENPDLHWGNLDILVAGLGEDDNLGRIFVSLSKYLYPDLNIAFYPSNDIQRMPELIKGITEQNHHIIPGTVGIIFDQPGQTHSTLNAVKWLIGHTNDKGMGMQDVYVITGNTESEMGDLLGKDHILYNHVGPRMEEPGVLAPLGSRLLINELLIFVYQRTLARAKAEGQGSYEREAYLQHDQLEQLKARRDVMIENLGTITGTSASPHHYETHKQLVKAGRRSGWNHLENVVGEFGSRIFLAFTLLGLHSPLAVGVVSLIAGPKYQWLSLAAFGVDCLIYPFVKASIIILIRVLQKRPALARMAGRSLTISDEPDTSAMVARAGKTMTGTSFTWADHGYKGVNRNNNWIPDEHAETRSDSEVLMRMAQDSLLPIDREGHESALSHVLGIQFWIVPQRLQRFLQNRGWDGILPKIGIKRVGPTATVLVHGDPNATPPAGLYKNFVTLPKDIFSVWLEDFQTEDVKLDAIDIARARPVDKYIQQIAQQQTKGDLVAAMNIALDHQDLFTHVSYHDYQLPAAIEPLIPALEKNELESHQIRVVNRVLLELSYSHAIIRNPLTVQAYEPKRTAPTLIEQRFRRLMEEMFNATEGHAAELVFVHAKESKIARFWLVRLLNPRRIDRSPDVTGVFSTKTNMFNAFIGRFRAGDLRMNAEKKVPFASINVNQLDAYNGGGVIAKVGSGSDKSRDVALQLTDRITISDPIGTAGVEWAGVALSPEDDHRDFSFDFSHELNPIHRTQPFELHVIFDFPNGHSVPYAISLRRIPAGEQVRLSIDQKSLINKRVQLSEVSGIRIIAMNAGGTMELTGDNGPALAPHTSEPIVPVLQSTAEEYTADQLASLADADDTVNSLFGDGKTTGVRQSSLFVLKQGHSPQEKRDLIYPAIPMGPRGNLLVRPPQFPIELYEGLFKILKAFPNSLQDRCVVQLVKDGDRLYYHHLGQSGEQSHGIYLVPERLVHDAFSNDSSEGQRLVASAVLKMEFAEELLERRLLLSGDTRSREEREHLMSEEKIRYFLQLSFNDRQQILEHLRDILNPYDEFSFGERVLRPAHEIYEAGLLGGLSVEKASMAAIRQIETPIREYVLSEDALRKAEDLVASLFNNLPNPKASTFLIRDGIWPPTEVRRIGRAIPLNENGHLMIRPPDFDQREYETLEGLFGRLAPQDDSNTAVFLMDNPERSAYLHKGNKGQDVGGAYLLSAQLVHDAAYGKEEVPDLQEAAQMFLLLEIAEERLERREMIQPAYSDELEKETAFSLLKVKIFLREIKDQPEMGERVIRITKDPQIPYDSAGFGERVLSVAYNAYLAALDQGKGHEEAAQLGAKAALVPNAMYVKDVLEPTAKLSSVEEEHQPPVFSQEKEAAIPSNPTKTPRHKIRLSKSVTILGTLLLIVATGFAAYTYNLYGTQDLIHAYNPFIHGPWDWSRLNPFAHIGGTEPTAVPTPTAPTAPITSVPPVVSHPITTIFQHPTIHDLSTIRSDKVVEAIRLPEWGGENVRHWLNTFHPNEDSANVLTVVGKNAREAAHQLYGRLQEAGIHSGSEEKLRAIIAAFNHNVGNDPSVTHKVLVPIAEAAKLQHLGFGAAVAQALQNGMIVVQSSMQFPMFLVSMFFAGVFNLRASKAPRPSLMARIRRAA